MVTVELLLTPVEAQTIYTALLTLKTVIKASHIKDDLKVTIKNVETVLAKMKLGEDTDYGLKPELPEKE